MKVVSIGFLAAFSGVESKQIRAPGQRASKNQQFLETWFENNCKRSGDSDDVVRPSRCENKFIRYMNEWEKLQTSFAKCGFFDENVPNGGPRPNSSHRRRRGDDYDGEYGEDYYNDEGLFDIEFFEMTNEEIDELDAYDDNAGESETTDDYVSIVLYKIDSIVYYSGHTWLITGVIMLKLKPNQHRQLTKIMEQ